MTTKEFSESVNEFTFEIRYKPNAKVLDNRGTWAELISDHMNLTEWRIVENRVDLFDKDTKNRVFVGFRNSGFVCHDVQTANYFPEQAVKFFKFVLNLNGFDAPLFVTRIGVRAKFYTTFEKSFEELCNLYSTRFLSLTDKAKEILNARLVDIGGPLNFTTGSDNFNTSSGPMAADQAQQFLCRTDDLPDVGLYFDIDYWQKPEKQVENREILGLISTYSKDAWKKHEDICNLILTD